VLLLFLVVFQVVLAVEFLFLHLLFFGNLHMTLVDVLRCVYLNNQLNLILKCMFYINFVFFSFFFQYIGDIVCSHYLVHLLRQCC
jgi:hypothetical protein